MNDMPFDLPSYLNDTKKAVDDTLDLLLRTQGKPLGSLEESVRYSVLSGGKRLRPILALASCEAVGGDTEKALPVACAIEMIHSYSLIHDDLPAMDDDALRRGVPTNHIVFGEAAAILAGDALLTDAFSVIIKQGLKRDIPPELLCEIVTDISQAAGSKGMIMGQAVDLGIEKIGQNGNSLTLSEIERMHQLKTGALIEVSVSAGAKLGGANNEELEKLSLYARSIGLAFQIVDDVLDVVGSGDMGKETGNDAKNLKSTYAGVAGVEESQQRAAELTKTAIDSISSLGKGADALRAIARYLGGRKS